MGSRPMKRKKILHRMIIQDQSCEGIEQIEANINVVGKLKCDQKN